MTKICTKCELEKPITSYFRNKASFDGHRPDCKLCTKESQKNYPRAAKIKAWRANNRDYVRHHNLKASFGIGLNEYNTMFSAQNGCCAICEIHQSALKRRLAVDHSHLTNKVRKLLCSNCNTAIGLLKENEYVIEKLKVYLQQHKTVI